MPDVETGGKLGSSQHQQKVRQQYQSRFSRGFKLTKFKSEIKGKTGPRIKIPVCLAQA